MTTLPSLSIEQLLAHEGFLRRIARDLVGEDSADDLVQDAWLAAIEEPPRHEENLKAWLATVVHRLSYRRYRQRRMRRELDANEMLEPPVDRDLERNSAIDTLGRAVDALREPYRGVVLLRYYEGLSPQRIAARLQRPANTVKSQLQRGLEQLRLRMDADFGGDRARWVHALNVYRFGSRPPVGHALPLHIVGLALLPIVLTLVCFVVLRDTAEESLVRVGGDRRPGPPVVVSAPEPTGDRASVGAPESGELVSTEVLARPRAALRVTRGGLAVPGARIDARSRSELDVPQAGDAVYPDVAIPLHVRRPPKATCGTLRPRQPNRLPPGESHHR